MTLCVKYSNSPKLAPKVVKPALESSFYLKIKNESNLLINMVGMIDLLSNMLSSSSISRRRFEKSSLFRDHLEVVTLNLDLHLLKMCEPEVEHSPREHSRT